MDEVIDEESLELDCTYENDVEIRNVLSNISDVQFDTDMSDNQWKKIIKGILQRYKSDTSLSKFKITLTTVMFAHSSFILFIADYLSDLYVTIEHLAKGSNMIILNIK